MKSLSSLVESEVRPLTSGEVIHADIEKLSGTERKLAYCLLQFIVAEAEARKKELNERIKEDVRQVGTVNEKGHVRQSDNGTVATVEKRVAKSPDEKALSTLLMTNKIDDSSVYDIVPTKVLNLSKVNQLVELGKLKAEDVEKLFKVTYALTVDPSEPISTLLEEAKKGFALEKALVTGKEPEPKTLEENTKGKGKKGKASAAP